MGKGSTAKQPTAVGSLQFQSAQRGGVIPLVYGTTRVAVNIIDYDDFVSFQVNAQNATKGKGGGGGKSGKSGQKITEYSASFIAGVCQGPIVGFGQAWYDKYLTTVSALPFVDSSNFGTDTQAPDPYWQSAHANKALAYAGTANVAFANYNMGPSTTLPNFSFEVLGVGSGSGINGMDADPSAILVDFLTNPRYGAGFPAANLDPTWSNSGVASSYASYVRAVGIWLSVSLETQQEAQQYLDTITKLTNSEVVWSGGLLKIVPRGDIQVVGVVTQNASWTINLGGGDLSGSDTASITISDPAFGTQTAQVSGFKGQHLTDFAQLLENSLQAIVSPFGIIITSFVSSSTPLAPPPASQNNSTIVIIEMIQNPPTGNTVVTVSGPGSDFGISVSTTAAGGVGTFTPPSMAIYSLTDDDFIAQESTVGSFLGPNPGGAALRSGGTPITGGFTSDPVHIVRSSPADADNSIRLECLDRGGGYNSTIVRADDQASIDLYGLRQQSPLNARAIVDPGFVGYTVAQLLLQRSIMQRNTYTFQLGWNYCLLEPMDLVQITDSRLGAAAVTVRITSIEEDAEGLLQVTAEDYFGAYNSPVLYPKANFVPAPIPTVLGLGSGSVTPRAVQPNSGFVPNQGVQVGNVNTPIIFEPPAALVTTQSALEIWVALSSTSPGWGGADIYMSLDGTSYALVGQTAGNSPMGSTTALLASYGGANPDTTDTLSVDLTESAGTLASVGASTASNLLNLVYCGGELISFQTATLTAAHKYNLTTLYRGAYGTTIGSHASSSAFAAISASITRLPFGSSLVGSTVHFKFVSFNTTFGGDQNLANVTDYPYVITGAGLGSANIYVSGSVTGRPGAGAQVQQFSFAQMTVFPIGFSGSVGHAVTTATGAVFFNIQRNNVTIGTMNFAIGQSTATFTLAAPVTFNPGDVMAILAPAVQDATLANVSWTIVGTTTAI
jgi:hypothetical protein